MVFEVNQVRDHTVSQDAQLYEMFPAGAEDSLNIFTFKQDSERLFSRKTTKTFELLVIFIHFLHCWYTWKDSVASSREQ